MNSNVDYCVLLKQINIESRLQEIKMLKREKSFVSTTSPEPYTR